jgi:hypothetical protein
MKNTKKLILLFLITSLLLVGCISEPFEMYDRAVRNTNNLTSGQMRTTVTINTSTNNIDLLDDEQATTTETFDFIIYSSFDVNQEIEQYNIYIKSEDVGYDFVIFDLSDEAYLKLPMQSKYLKLSEIISQENIINEANFNIDQMLTLLSTEWLALLERENVVRGSNTVMAIEDGDVRATKYEIKPSEDQLKDFIKRIITTIEENEEVFEQFIHVPDNQTFSETMIPWIDNLEQIEFSYQSYIDVDAYIVNEFINLVLGDELISTDINIKLEYWDNNGEQNFDLPDFSDDNIIDFEDFENEFFIEIGR